MGVAAPVGAAATPGRTLTASASSWSTPQRIFGPVASDLLAPELAVSVTGQLAVGSGTTDEDTPSSAQADVLTSTGVHHFAALQLKGTQEVLAAAYAGSRLVLLTGTSPANKTLACCSTATVMVESGGRIISRRVVANGLAGASTGELVPLSNGLLAVTDNQTGIWVARAGPSGVFGRPRKLADGGAQPPLVAAGSLANGGAVVAWTTPASWQAGAYAPQVVHDATTGPAGLPHGASVALTAPEGDTVGALQVAGNRTGATLAFTESWFDAVGDFHSVADAADVGRGGAVVKQLSPSSVLATSVSMAAAAGGRQVVAWQACGAGSDLCSAEAALRPHGYAWGPARHLGGVDTTSFPVAAESPLGQAMVGWISGGDVYTRAAGRGAGGFAAAHAISRAGVGSDLALVFGPGTKALAAWAEGTDNVVLEAAEFG